MENILLIITIQTILSAMINGSYNVRVKKISSFLLLCILPIAIYNAMELVEAKNNYENNDLLDDNLF